MAKKKSKIKSALKKIGKAAAIAGAGYLAMKGLKNRKENKDFLKTEGGDKSDMRDYGPFSKGTGPTNAPSKFTASKTVLGKRGINRLGDTDDNMYAAKGGRATKTKPKSIGKALRGGGKVMR